MTAKNSSPAGDPRNALRDAYVPLDAEVLPMSLPDELFSMFKDTFSPHRQRMLEQANEGVGEPPPDAEFDRWCDAREAERPLTLPNASQADIEIEVGRIRPKRFTARAHEI